MAATTGTADPAEGQSADEVPARHTDRDASPVDGLILHTLCASPVPPNITPSDGRTASDEKKAGVDALVRIDALATLTVSTSG